MDVLLFCLIGGIVAADTEAAWQSMASQPLIACSLAGICLGNFGLGFTVGLLLQLPYMVELPVGGAKVSMSNLAAFVAAGLAVKIGQSVQNVDLILLLSLAYGVLLSWATFPFWRLLRQINLLLVRKADDAFDSGNLRKITLMNVLGVVNALFFGIYFSAIFFFLGKYILLSVSSPIPFQLNFSASLLKPVLLGAGLGAMFWLFLKKKTVGFALIGSLLSATAFSMF